MVHDYGEGSCVVVERLFVRVLCCGGDAILSALCSGKAVVRNLNCGEAHARGLGCLGKAVVRACVVGSRLL